MRLFTFLLPFAVIASAITVFPVYSQTQLVGGSFFPAESEFRELKAIHGERDLNTPAELAKLEHGRVLREAGLTRLAERSYVLSDARTLSIEVMTLADARGAYSLLTLLRKADIQAGPPGNYFASAPETLVFVSGDYCVRIRTDEVGELAHRVAVSVSNRIGVREPNLPMLVRHFPRDSYDPATVRYLLGPQALASFGTPVMGGHLRVPPDVEIAQADCAVEGQTGTMTLLSFQTIPLAEEYFGSIGGASGETPSATSLYTRQTGPLVGILEGNFTPQVADKTLGSIRFSYSIKWIFDRNQQRSGTIWGVPVKVLGTVVRSLLFTMLLCLMSVVAGTIIAFGRIYVRRHWGRSDDEGYIRLKINEN